MIAWALVMVFSLLGCVHDDTEVVDQPTDAPIVVRKQDRCTDYVHLVRREHFRCFGLDFPYWYGVGQLRQESGCRADATAFDGGQGPAQFMPATEREAEEALGPLDLYNPEHAVRAQAWYMARLHRANPDGRLWITYMFYNSGQGTVTRESARAGGYDYDTMKAVCSRRVITLKRGQKLDLCAVGYDYPVKVHAYGQQYKQSEDRRRFW